MNGVWDEGRSHCFDVDARLPLIRRSTPARMELIVRLRERWCLVNKRWMWSLDAEKQQDSYLCRERIKFLTGQEFASEQAARDAAVAYIARKVVRGQWA